MIKDWLNHSPLVPMLWSARNIYATATIQIGLTYLLKTIAACNASETPVLEQTANLAFMDYFASFWNNTPVEAPSISPHNSTLFHVYLEDYSQDPAFPIYGGERDPHPSTLRQLSQLQYQKQVFLDTRKKLFNGKQAERHDPYTPRFRTKIWQKFLSFYSGFPHLHFHRKFNWYCTGPPICHLCH